MTPIEVYNEQDAIKQEQKACNAQDARHRNLEGELRLVLALGVPL